MVFQLTERIQESQAKAPGRIDLITESQLSVITKLA
jgi:hypothetical protein